MVVTGAPRKRLVGKPARGFESHPLRQPSASAPGWWRGWASVAARLAPLRARIPARFLRQPSASAPGWWRGWASVAARLAPLRARIPARFLRQPSASAPGWWRGWASVAARLAPLRARIPARFLRQPSASAPGWWRGWASVAARLAPLRARIPAHSSPGFRNSLQLASRVESPTPARRPSADARRQDLPPSPGGNSSSMEQPKKTANFLAFSTVIVLYRCRATSLT